MRLNRRRRAVAAVLALLAAAAVSGCTAGPAPEPAPHYLPARVISPSTCNPQAINVSVEGAKSARGLVACAGGFFVGSKPVTVKIHPGDWIYVAAGKGKPFDGKLVSSHQKTLSVSSNVLRGVSVGKADIRTLSGIDCNTRTGATKPSQCVLLSVRVEK